MTPNWTQNETYWVTYNKMKCEKIKKTMKGKNSDNVIEAGNISPVTDVKRTHQTPDDSKHFYCFLFQK